MTPILAGTPIPQNPPPLARGFTRRCGAERLSLSVLDVAARTIGSHRVDHGPAIPIASGIIFRSKQGAEPLYFPVAPKAPRSGKVIRFVKAALFVSGESGHGMVLAKSFDKVTIGREARTDKRGNP